MISKEEVLKIKNIKGTARGQALINNLGCVEFMEGAEGLARLKKALKELNCWSEEFDDFKKIKIFEWYPFWQDIIPIIVAVDLFGWDEEKIRSFGRCNQKISFLEKTLLKHFVSIEQVLKLAPDRWRKHYNHGEIELVEYNPKEKYTILRLKNFSGHPNFCLLLCGYFESISSLVLVRKNPKCQETKCTFKGDKYHEFIVSWD